MNRKAEPGEEEDDQEYQQEDHGGDYAQLADDSNRGCDGADSLP